MAAQKLATTVEIIINYPSLVSAVFPGTARSVRQEIWKRELFLIRVRMTFSLTFSHISSDIPG